MIPFPLVRWTLLSLITCIALVAAERGAESRPNFIVILADDLGWGDLPANGHPHIRTPNLDRLAAGGIRLTSCYAASQVCSPSRAGLLTGRSPNRAGVYEWIADADTDWIAAERSRHLVHLRQHEITLPRLLKEAGYATAMAGKWHCNARFNQPAQAQPNDLGFDHWLATQNNAKPSHENPTNFVRNGEAIGRQEGFSCQIVAREAISWLEAKRAQSAGQPFFLYVAFHEPHEPVASPPDLVRQHLEHARNPDEAQYFANVENMDRAVGELLAALDRMELAENTLVLFTSDNGPETLFRYPGTRRSYGSAGPLRGMKLWTTEGGPRVPGILRWPAKVKAGQVSDQAVSSLDLLPTFCALAGAKIPAGLKLDGADIRSVLDNRPVTREQPLFWVYFNALNDQRVALRDGPWKLLAKLDAGKVPMLDNITTANVARVREAQLTDFSLYRVTDDISESRELSHEEPARLKELSAKLEQVYRELTQTMHVWPEEPMAAVASPDK
jgi:arylsulfatase A